MTIQITHSNGKKPVDFEFNCSRSKPVLTAAVECFLNYNWSFPFLQVNYSTHVQMKITYLLISFNNSVAQVYMNVSVHPSVCVLPYLHLYSLYIVAM